MRLWAVEDWGLFIWLEFLWLLWPWVFCILYITIAIYIMLKWPRFLLGKAVAIVFLDIALFLHLLLWQKIWQKSKHLMNLRGHWISWTRKMHFLNCLMKVPWELKEREMRFSLFQCVEWVVQMINASPTIFPYTQKNEYSDMWRQP